MNGDSLRDSVDESPSHDLATVTWGRKSPSFHSSKSSQNVDLKALRTLERSFSKPFGTSVRTTRADFPNASVPVKLSRKDERRIFSKRSERSSQRSPPPSFNVHTQSVRWSGARFGSVGTFGKVRSRLSDADTSSETGMQARRTVGMPYTAIGALIASWCW